MAGRSYLLVFACVASLALANAAPLRNDADCISTQMLQISGLNVYPSSHQIQSSKVQSLQDRTTVTVAQNFEVAYYSTFKILTNLYSGYNESYVLYQCGTTPPDVTQYGLPTTTKVLSVPLRSVAVSDTSALTFLKLLGVESRVSYVTPYAVDPCMQLLAGAACNHTSDKATSEQVDAKIAGWSLNRTDPLSVVFTATSDPGPLNRAEYLKYLATLFNREAAANTAFAAIVAAYDSAKQAASAFKAARNVSSPLVAWLYYQPYYGVMYPEQVALQFAAYRKQYTEDAGGRLHDLAQLNATYGDGVNVTIAGGGTQLRFTNLNSSLAVLRAVLKSVDVVIDESYAANPSAYSLDTFLSLYGLTDSAAAAELPFLASQRLLRLDGSASPQGYTAWYEEAVARPDVVLHDLVSAFLPGALLAAGDSSSPRLVRSVFASNPSRVVLSAASQCSSSGAAQCGAAAALTPICPAVYIACNGSLVAATEAQPCAPATCTPAPPVTTSAAVRPLATPLVMMAALVGALLIVLGAGSWAL